MCIMLVTILRIMMVIVHDNYDDCDISNNLKPNFARKGRQVSLKFWHGPNRVSSIPLLSNI